MISLRTTFLKVIELGFALAILVLGLVFYLAHQKIQALSEASNLMAHTQMVRLALSQLIAQVQETETLERRFLMTGDSVYRVGYARRVTDIENSLERVSGLTRDNPLQRLHLGRLQELVQERLQLLQTATQTDSLKRSVVLAKGVATTDSIQARVQRMDQAEIATLAGYTATRDRSLRMAPFFALVLLLLALIILVTAYLKIKADLQNSQHQLSVHLENTKQITALNLALQHAEQIAHTGNWQMDLATGERQYSENIYRLFGYAPDAFQPTLINWLPMVHPDDRQMVWEFGELARQRRQDPRRITFRFTRPDGQLRYLEASGRIITTAEGDATLIGTVQDVTESHRLRHQLEERTRLAEMLIESSVDMIAAYDKELRYTVWNKRCEELLHLKKQDVVGKSVHEVFPTAQGQGITQALDRALAGESVYVPPHLSSISDQYYESYALPLRDEVGAVTGVLTITHDITESYTLRRQLEERSRFAETIIESSVDLIITYDTNLCVTAWNRKSEEIFRFTKAEALGRHVTEVFPHIAGTTRLEDLQLVLNGQALQYPPHELSPFGIHANLYLLPLKDHTGQVTGVLSITHDVTDVVQSAARLAALNQSLEEKNRELANTNAELASFSYVASHDLQEPLRKIQSFASRILVAEKEHLSEQGQDAFRRMQSAASRMQQLIDDLLTYSRTNTQAGEFSIMDLNSLLHEAEQEVSEAIQEKQAVIEADPLPMARVLGFQFRQLLANLLSNALKYQRPGVAPHIRITCTTVPGEEVPQPDALGKKYIKIAVADNGIGFEQQYAERIFELFQRLHGRSEYQGTGIGLAICRKIVQNHHGYLLADGRPGEGAVFTIYLPV